MPNLRPARSHSIGAEEDLPADLETLIDEDSSIGVVVSDKNQIITHVNKGFATITGYSTEESVGRNCRFLQGEATNDDAVDIIRSALKNKEPCKVAIVNYRKDGTAFWNTLTVIPLFDHTGEITSFVGLQMTQVVAFMERPLPHFKWTNLDRKSPEPASITYNRKKSPRKINPDSRAQRNEEIADYVEQYLEESEEKDNRENAPPINNVQFVAETQLPTEKGVYRVIAYKDISKSGEEADIIVIADGDIEDRKEVVCRVHDQCFTSEVIHSLKCDCRLQLDYAMDFIKDRKKCPVGGMIVYMPQEGRGIGLANKIKAYSMQELGLDTVDANRILGFEDDYRDYRGVRAILNHLRIKSLQLMTNNPRKIEQLTKAGCEISGRIPIIMKTNAHSHGYVKAKGARMRHFI